jgi:hypothetical protein
MAMFCPEAKVLRTSYWSILPQGRGPRTVTVSNYQFQGGSTLSLGILQAINNIINTILTQSNKAPAKEDVERNGTSVQ